MKNKNKNKIEATFVLQDYHLNGSFLHFNLKKSSVLCNARGFQGEYYCMEFCLTLKKRRHWTPSKRISEVEMMCTVYEQEAVKLKGKLA